MHRTLAATTILLVSVFTAFLTQNGGDVLVFERPGNQWFEGVLTNVSISTDGKSAIFFDGLGSTELYSLATSQADPERLRGGLDKLDAADFCGSDGFLRLGDRGNEAGLFLPGNKAAELSKLPQDAVPVCSPDGREIAFYRYTALNHSVYVGTPDNYREYPLNGKIRAMTFSRDGEKFYGLILLPENESAFVSIEVRTGKMRIIASHLDASPISAPITISPDGKHAYLALASDAAPNNEARHKPDADRWLKIYELDVTTGSRRLVVSSPGQDNSAPQIVNGTLYWTRTVVEDSIVVVPSRGGPEKEVIAGGEIPMWSPEGKRIGYTYGGWRLADWALNLDDAVVALTKTRIAHPSQPSSFPVITKTSRQHGLPMGSGSPITPIALRSQSQITLAPAAPMTSISAVRTMFTRQKFALRISVGKRVQPTGRRTARGYSLTLGNGAENPA
ncbi:MAG TPA: hypothetical protein VMG82_20400 [Candidatus Sulfotelmatobacter sp.]|nr:hypothetical protein [Candidatus Sulfotelmatobacter sp.]